MGTVYSGRTNYKTYNGYSVTFVSTCTYSASRDGAYINMTVTFNISTSGAGQGYIDDNISLSASIGGDSANGTIYASELVTGGRSKNLYLRFYAGATTYKLLSVSQSSPASQSASVTGYYPAADGPSKPTISLNKSIMAPTDTVTVTVNVSDWGDGSAGSYTRQYSKNAGSWITFSGSTFTPSDYGGTYGDVFQFRAQVTNSLGLTSAWSTDYDSITCASLPTAVDTISVDIALVEDNLTDITLSWSGAVANSGDITSYDIIFSAPGQADVTINVTTSPYVFDVVAIFPALAAGNAIDISIKVYNTYNLSALSAVEESIVMYAVGPVAPANLNAPAYINMLGDVLLSWTAAVPGSTALDTYTIQMRLKQDGVWGDYADVITISAINTQYTIPNTVLIAAGMAPRDDLQLRIKTTDVLGLDSLYTESLITPVKGGIMYLKPTGAADEPYDQVQMYFRTATAMTLCAAVYVKTAENTWKESTA